MAPEYINDGEITKKSDIYSLGKIILEIITGKRNTKPNIESVRTYPTNFRSSITLWNDVYYILDSVS